MHCPKCKGDTAVTNTLHNDDLNEVYRRRKCKDCGYSFYTVEEEKEVKGAFRIILSKARFLRAQGRSNNARSK